jgi:AcrR family transcriptional regulator
MTGRGAKGEARRTLLLDTTEALIVQEGYAAVSTRRVAQEAGVNPSLVHYYYATTEDLLLAVYERAGERTHKRTLEALASPRPLEAFWTLNKDSTHTALGTELYALANHRKLIREDVARMGVALRLDATQALSRAVGTDFDRGVCDPAGLMVVLTGIARMLVMEEATGLTTGHPEARALIEWLIDRVMRKTPDAGATEAEQVVKSD